MSDRAPLTEDIPLLLTVTVPAGTISRDVAVAFSRLLAEHAETDETGTMHWHGWTFDGAREGACICCTENECECRGEKLA